MDFFRFVYLSEGEFEFETTVSDKVSIFQAFPLPSREERNNCHTTQKQLP